MESVGRITRSRARALTITPGQESSAVTPRSSRSRTARGTPRAATPTAQQLFNDDAGTERVEAEHASTILGNDVVQLNDQEQPESAAAPIDSQQADVDIMDNVEKEVVETVNASDVLDANNVLPSDNSSGVSVTPGAINGPSNNSSDIDVVEFLMSPPEAGRGPEFEHSMSVLTGVTDTITSPALHCTPTSSEQVTASKEAAAFAFDICTSKNDSNHSTKSSTPTLLTPFCEIGSPKAPMPSPADNLFHTTFVVTPGAIQPDPLADNATHTPAVSIADGVDQAEAFSSDDHPSSPVQSSDHHIGHVFHPSTYMLPPTPLSAASDMTLEHSSPVARSMDALSPLPDFAAGMVSPSTIESLAAQALASWGLKDDDHSGAGNEGLIDATVGNVRAECAADSNTTASTAELAPHSPVTLSCISEHQDVTTPGSVAVGSPSTPSTVIYGDVQSPMSAVLYTDTSDMEVKNACEMDSTVLEVAEPSTGDASVTDQVAAPYFAERTDSPVHNTPGLDTAIPTASTPEPVAPVAATVKTVLDIASAESNLSKTPKAATPVLKELSANANAATPGYLKPTQSSLGKSTPKSQQATMIENALPWQAVEKPQMKSVVVPTETYDNRSLRAIKKQIRDASQRKMKENKVFGLKEIRKQPTSMQDWEIEDSLTVDTTMSMGESDTEEVQGSYNKEHEDILVSAINKLDIRKVPLRGLPVPQGQHIRFNDNGVPELSPAPTQRVYLNGVPPAEGKHIRFE